MQKPKITSATGLETHGMRPVHRIGVALIASFLAHYLILAWVRPLPPPPVDTTFIVTLGKEPAIDNASAPISHPTRPRVTPPPETTAPPSPRMPLTAIARDLLRADAEHRRQRQARNTSAVPPSVMFDNLKDNRFTPENLTPVVPAISGRTTATGNLVYQRVRRDGKISCVIVRPANPNNEYDQGAIYTWSLDFDRNHLHPGAC